MVFPTGEQYEINAGSYSAVITEVGARLRSLTFDGTDPTRPRRAGREHIYSLGPTDSGTGAIVSVARSSSCPLTNRPGTMRIMVSTWVWRGNLWHISEILFDSGSFSGPDAAGPGSLPWRSCTS